MVSLPRIAGESASQREKRVALEKASAETRNCDFCPPLIEAIDAPEEVTADIVEVVAPVESATNGSPVTREVPAARPEPKREPRRRAARAEPTNGRAKRVRAPDAAEATPAQLFQFRVVFRADAVVDAATIWDALARADELGAVEVTRITRLDR
jgi:hypothetical protein